MTAHREGGSASVSRGADSGALYWTGASLVRMVQMFMFNDTQHTEHTYVFTGGKKKSLQSLHQYTLWRRRYVKPHVILDT